MKKLFKRGLLSLLMGSLVVASGCYKKDIDDIEDRLTDLEKRLSQSEINVEDNADAIAVLQGLIEKKGTVSDVKMNGNLNANNLELVISYADGTASKTLSIPYTPPANPTTKIIKTAPVDKGAYFEFEIYSDNKEGAYYVVRMGKYFDTASGVNVLSESIRTTAGNSAYAIVDVNPSGYTLTADKLNFDEYDYTRAVTGVSGLPSQLELVGVTRASTFSTDADTAPIWTALTEDAVISALEGRWVIEFKVLEQVTRLDYKLLVEFPKNSAAYNGCWISTAVPAAPTTVEMQYAISDNLLEFRDRVIPFTAQTALSVQTTEATPAQAATMYSDGSVDGTVKLVNYAADPNVYLGAPSLDTRPQYLIYGTPNYYFTVKVYNNAGEEQNYNSNNLNILRSYLQATNFTIPNPAVTDVWKNVKFSMLPDDQMSTTVFPAGWKVEYTFRYYTNSGAILLGVPQTITSNNFKLTVTRVQYTYEIPEANQIGPKYIPVNNIDGLKNYGSFATGLKSILTGMGYSETDIAAATYTGTAYDKWNGTAWVVYTGTDAFTTTTPTTSVDLKLNVLNTVPVGKYRISYKIKVAGRDIVIHDYIQIVPPTAYLKIKSTYDTTVQIPVTGTTTPNVTSVSLYTNTTAPVDLTTILDMSPAITGRTAITGNTAWNTTDLGIPTGNYLYQNGSDNLGGNLYGLVASMKTVPRNADGKATRIMLTVTLSTGQQIPVVVNRSTYSYNANDAEANIGVGDWANGTFYVTVLGNTVASVIGANMGTYPMSATHETPVDVSAALTAVNFITGAPIVPTPVSGTSLTATAYQMAKTDPRIASITFTPGTILNAATLPSGTTTLFEITYGTKTESGYTYNVVMLKTLSGFASWADGETYQQNLKITVTDIFGVSKETTVLVTFSHNN